MGAAAMRGEVEQPRHRMSPGQQTSKVAAWIRWPAEPLAQKRPEPYQSPSTYTADVKLVAGQHTVVEYYELSGDCDCSFQ